MAGVTVVTATPRLAEAAVATSARFVAMAVAKSSELEWPVVESGAATSNPTLQVKVDKSARRW